MKAPVITIENLQNIALKKLDKSQVSDLSKVFEAAICRKPISQTS